MSRLSPSVFLFLTLALSGSASAGEDPKHIPLRMDGAALKESAQVRGGQTYLPFAALAKAIGYVGVGCLRSTEESSCSDETQELIVLVDEEGDGWYRQKPDEDDLTLLEGGQRPILAPQEVWIAPEHAALVLKVEVAASAEAVEVTTPWKGRYDPAVARAFDVAETKHIQVGNARIQALVKKLTAGIESPMGKVRAVHDWLAKNIKYDEEGLKDPETAIIDAVRVLKRRKGICAGYANLTAALLRAAGFPTRFVAGWARDSNEVWPEVLAASPEDPNHAWNDVLVEGRWVTMDVTWDAGYTTRGEAVKRGTLYFDPPAERFAEDHITSRPVTQPSGDSWWFRLGQADIEAVSQTAEALLEKRLGKYRKTCSFGLDADPVGRMVRGQVEAWVVGTRTKCTEKGSLLFRFAPEPAGWRLVEVVPHTEGEELPSGAWPAPESIQRQVVAQ